MVIRTVAVGALLAGLLCAAGCAPIPAAPAPAPTPTRSPYAGPLVITPDAEQAKRIWDWPGAAGEVLDCTAEGIGGSRSNPALGPYREGAVAASPRAALRVADGEGFFLDGFSDLLQEERRAGNRVLYTTVYGGAVKQAVIVVDGPASEGSGAGPDGRGWHLESWARCDYADFPDSVAARWGAQVWRDRAGRVDTDTVSTWRGPEHCSWESMTLLHLGDRMFVRAPLPELGEYFAEPYRQHVPVPADAVDTGFHRGADHLWVAAGDERAYVGTRADAESWPVTIEPLGCA